jgi:hypothetical protein
VLGERGRQVRLLVQDRDAKFCRGFDEVFRSDGGEVLRTPVRAPTANAYAQRSTTLPWSSSTVTSWLVLAQGSVALCQPAAC